MKRIMIFGASGTGKSTLARALAAKLDLPVVHIDPMYYRAGWVQRAPEETRELVRLAADNARWVFDGNNSKTMDYRAERADLIVYLEAPRWLRLFRVLRRSFKHYGHVRPDMADGCPERFEWNFLKWVWNYKRDHGPKTAAFLDRWQGKVEIVRLSSLREYSAFLDRV